ncbi:MAG TPA: diguanylate cyclase [Planctomycetota bacterium]|nr:diguanylate cyclase [Planctomycetota bacterium]
MIQQRFDELRLTGALPSPSAIGLRILDLTQDENYDQADLIQTIMADPALSGRVIQMANSALHAGAEPVETVREAAVRMGSKALRGLALGFSLVERGDGRLLGGLDHHSFWSRSLATAVATSILAYECRAWAPAEAFTCGLLADIGKLAFASLYPQKYQRFMSLPLATFDWRLAKLESCAFGVNHAEVASLMMEDWGFSRALQQAVLHCIDRPSGPMPRGAEAGSEALMRVLRGGRALADVLTIERDTGEQSWLPAFFRLEQVAEELGMPVEQLHRLGNQIQPAWLEWGKLLGIPSGQGIDFVETARELDSAGVAEVTDLAYAEPPETQCKELREMSQEDTDPVEIRSELEHSATRVLLIDDDEQMLRLLSHYLQRAGYHVETALSSKEGLRKAISLAPHIVVTDWMMPGMTGVELCRALRETPTGKRMYVLLVTARGDDVQVLEAFEAGADDYIVKPFNPRILVARTRAGQRTVEMRQKVESSERLQQRQIAHLAIMTRKLRQAALTDVLTNLPNRRYGMNRLQEEWENALRTDHPLSVAMMDIDYFKRVNDDFGHDAGDAVLKECAEVLRHNMRRGDVLARLGGEEFLLIHVGASLEEAAAGCERLRAAVEQIRVPYQGSELMVTMSFGVAEKRPGQETIDDLMKDADNALYDAKDQGRNRVIAHEPPQDEGSIRRAAS